MDHSSGELPTVHSYVTSQIAILDYRACRVPELIPVLGSQLPLLSARPAVTFATLERAATNFAVW